MSINNNNYNRREWNKDNENNNNNNINNKEEDRNLDHQWNNNRRRNDNEKDETKEQERNSNWNDRRSNNRGRRNNHNNDYHHNNHNNNNEGKNMEWRGERGRGMRREEGRNERRNQHNIDTSEMNQLNSNFAAKQRRECRFKQENERGNIMEERNQNESNEFIGTSTTMEKEYTRLTSAPISSNVRPQSLLIEWLPILLSRLNEGKVDYGYFSDQMKSIRQDLTVQNIRNSFICKVYFVHMKNAAKHNDMQEFLVCLSCLENLGNDRILSDSQSKKVLACKLLTCYLQNNEEALNELIRQLRGSILDHKYIRYSVDILRSLNSFMNYHKFFRIIHKTSNPLLLYLSKSIALRNLRKDSMIIVCKAYRPSIPTSFIMNELGFDDLSHLKSCLHQWGAFLEKEEIMCKESFQPILDSK